MVFHPYDFVHALSIGHDSGNCFRKNCINISFRQRESTHGHSMCFVSWISSHIVHTRNTESFHISTHYVIYQNQFTLISIICSQTYLSQNKWSNLNWFGWRNCAPQSSHTTYSRSRPLCRSSMCLLYSSSDVNLSSQIRHLNIWLENMW